MFAEYLDPTNQDAIGVDTINPGSSFEEITVALKNLGISSANKHLAMSILIESTARRLVREDFGADPNASLSALYLIRVALERAEKDAQADLVVIRKLHEHSATQDVECWSEPPPPETEFFMMKNREIRRRLAPPEPTGRPVWETYESSFPS